jgi:hypothetical protein
MDERTIIRSRQLIATCLAAVAGLFIVDAALFRSNLYPSVLEPDSSTGLFELTLRIEKLAQRQLGDNLICTLGDSRFAYTAKYTNELTPETGYIFRNAGIAGSDARSWYYLLRDLDPQAHRYQAIVIGLDSYDDEDNFGEHADDIRALHYVVNRLRWYDVFDFPWSFRDPQLRWEAFRGTLLKGFVFQRDIHAFLDDPKKRIAYVHLVHREAANWRNDYEAPTVSMAGLSIDWTTGQVAYPLDMDASQKDTLEYALKAPPVSTYHLGDFRRLWFGRILDRYQGSRTRIVFLRLARGPVPRPAHPPLPSSIRDFAKRPNVLLYDEHAFEFLEHPELFRDAVHLNRQGSHLFSAALARGIRQLLGPPVAAH